MMRIIVVGAGVVGLLTAWECHRAGAAVTLLEQDRVPSAGAASYDRHRVLRAFHRGDPGLARAAQEAHRLWLDWERVLDADLYRRVGALSLLDPADAPGQLELLRSARVAADLLHGRELRARCPYLAVPAGAAGLLERDAGVLLADRVLTALADGLTRLPDVRVEAGRQVAALDADGSGVVLADGERLRGDAVVVAAGPWSRSLLEPAQGSDLRLYRQTLLYCEVPAGRREAWERAPAIPALGTPAGAWLVPPVAGTPLKLSASAACREVAGIDGREAPRELRAFLVEHFTGLVAGFAPSWVRSAADSYYLAEAGTHGPRLCRPSTGPAWVYAACGGSSFKFAPLIGRALARRATGREPQEPTGLPFLDHPFPTTPPEEATAP
ncbi:NAD(P)/FAD-dependent oxidoreductase [Kitasatospora sp. NPDC059571]|uniref:NAD(P)/FAD-dependent oxidoreductase n=1 Tax=Kitasatospora sp. NPDC059571 TaxID=3346871 RepID=UPI0036B4E7A6